MRIIKKRSPKKTENSRDATTGSSELEISGYDFVDLSADTRAFDSSNQAKQILDDAEGTKGEPNSHRSKARLRTGREGTARKKSQDDRQTVLARGIHLLSMREHSVFELADKLSKKGFDATVIDSVVEELKTANYVNDERFAESYIRSKQMRGMGPIKIKSELHAKGVSSAIIDEYVNDDDASWYDAAESLHQKKYGDKELKTYKEWTARARFLQGRGFTMDHIHSTVPQFDGD